MLNTITSVIDRLYSVKSIVTIILTCVFSYLAIQGRIDGKEFLTIFTVVIACYFGTQSEKQRAREALTSDHEKEDDNNETRGPGSENKGVA